MTFLLIGHELALRIEHFHLMSAIETFHDALLRLVSYFIRNYFRNVFNQSKSTYV